MDLLSVEAMDKMHICLDLLCEYGYVERKATLRETYESTIGIYNLERENQDMWHMVWNHDIQSLFQMEKQSGIQGIALTKPESVDDLAHLNSIIRLMAQEKGGEMPLNKYARFKENIQLWYDEMRDFGLKPSEMKILEPIIKGSYGICESQEAFMQLVQIPECGGFDLNFADKLRKAIAKKNPKAYDELTKEYFETCKEKGLSMNLCNYVWNVLVATSRGYGFNLSHTLAYSLIALQEMNLAYRYPIMFWNCACLISDAGGAESEDSTEETEEKAEIFYEDYEGFEDFVEEDKDEADEDDEEEEEEEVSKENKKKKKKVKATNYGKIATAIGKIASTGVQIAPPDANKSNFTFSPDIDGNAIRYGLSGITRIWEELIKNILANRPYSGVLDFASKVKLNKPQMINLIKSGAFDEFGDRLDIMHEYINSISDCKKRITLQNMKMLIDFRLIPDEYDLQCRVFNFNKYIKKMKLDATYYGLDQVAYDFYEQYFDLDKLEVCDATESSFKIKQVIWDNIYQRQMDIIRPYVKAHAAELLKAVNDKLTQDMWKKYCKGTISKWEMDSISCYIHEHELAHIDNELYGFSDFNKLSEVPEVERYYPIKGKMVPIFRLHRIAGTVLDRDKAKKLVTLLTTTGVVTVKIYGVFQQYDKQISERGADGKKHVLEKSAFSRGNKIIVTGIREGDTFLAKVYKNTPWHRVELIDEVYEDGTISTRVRGEED